MSAASTDPIPPRPGEIAIELPAATDAGVHFIGRIRTPWRTRAETPRNSLGGRDVEAAIELDPRYAQGLSGVQRCSHLIVLYWLDRGRRDLIVQVPSHLGEPRGVFALRSPVRPNPIGLSVVELVGVDGTRLAIRGIDCLDGTPLIDIKPYYASTDCVPDARPP
jgi:tRNA-Thr(GGU) m(6)t(6)A37 methyltransferase TsaA